MRRVALPWLAGAPVAGGAAAGVLCAFFLEWNEGVPPIILAAAGTALLAAAAWLRPYAGAVDAASLPRAAFAGFGAVLTAHALHACAWASRQALSFGLSWTEAWLWQRKLQLWACVVTVPTGVLLAVLLAGLLRSRADAEATGAQGPG